MTTPPPPPPSPKLTMSSVGMFYTDIAYDNHFTSKKTPNNNYDNLLHITIIINYYYY